MNKNIVTTLIAGTFFAASLVAPAFATDNAASKAEITSQSPDDIGDVLPDIKFPKQLPTFAQVADRLKNLDVGAILERAKLPKSIELPEGLPELGPIKLPKSVTVPELEPIKLPKSVELPKVEPVIRPELVPAARPVEVPVTAPVDEPELVNPSRVPVKTIVDATKAEKASILADHGGDRRAAKAELKAAQMRMVAQIKTNNAARGQGNAKRHR